MSEKVLGVFDVSRFGGWRGGEHKRVLIFTENRIIVAETGGRKGTLARLALGGITGALTGVGVFLEKNAKKEGEKLLALPVEDILKADKKNFAIDNSEVVSVEFKGLQITIKTTDEATNKKKYKKYPKWLDKWVVEGIPGVKAKSRWGLSGEEIVSVLKQCVPPEKLVIK